MFYISPPTGQVSLHVLEKCVFERLEFLRLLHRGRSDEFNGNFEYLLENTIYDRIGHFTLRILAATTRELLDSWIKWETLLFLRRLDFLSPRQLHRMLRAILRDLRALTDKESAINRTLIDLCRELLKPDLFKHVISQDHALDCSFFAHKVEFQLLPDLVKRRQVDLDTGYAVVYCAQWRRVLGSLYRTYITGETNRMKTQASLTLKEDDRLHCLQLKVCDKLFHKSCEPGRITAQNIDAESAKFPLCMQSLHTRLRRSHRLSHYARFYYSLFLKDCGMRMEDAVKYWREEYSKPHSCGSACSHDWKTSERKFLYSIRHMYGVEGARKDYKSPSCDYICNKVPSTSYEGGCPFKNFDTAALRTLLSKSLSHNEIAEFLKTLPAKDPQSACAKFLRLNKNVDAAFISSPAQYYKMTLDPS